MDKATEHKIANYRPRKNLSAAKWEVAQHEVRALVRKAKPADAWAANNYLGNLCAFLAASPLWDGVTAPDLTALLTGPAIAEYVKNTQETASSNQIVLITRLYLTRLSRAAAGLALTLDKNTVERKVKPPSKELAKLLSIPGTSTVEGVAAWKQWSGQSATEHKLNASVAIMPEPARDAELVLLADFRPHLPWEVSLMAARDSRPTPQGTGTAAGTKSEKSGKPGKPMSRAAALRHAKEALAEAERIKAGPVLAVTAPPVPKELADIIASYRPQDVPDETWEKIYRPWKRLLQGYGLNPKMNPLVAARHIVNFLVWFSNHQVRDDPARDVELKELLTPGLVDTWIAGVDAPNGSKITARAAVKRALRSLDANLLSKPLPYQPRVAPYTEEECEKLRTLAATQRSLTVRRTASFLIGLAAGAGLQPGDFRDLRRKHIRRQTLVDGREVLVVDVQGRMPRTVVVRGYYAASVEMACRLHDEKFNNPDGLVTGAKANRSDTISSALRRMETGADGETISVKVDRLRSTWLLKMMCSAVPTNVLLHAAGLKTTRALTDLLPYCPPVPQDSILAILTAAGLDMKQVAK